MLKVTTNQLNQVKKWKLSSNPFKAIDDYNELKTEQRWGNREHFDEFNKNFNRRKKISPKKNVFKYYKNANLLIDEKTWNYLRLRKPYYIMPLGWENIAKNGGKIIDMGCGDGDVVQNLIDFIKKHWKKNKIKPKKIQIIGVDLNRSRIKNANRFVKSNSKYIKTVFLVGDLTKKNSNLFKKKFFDYCICTAVLEMLDSNKFENFLNNISKFVKKGLYIQELVEKFPGGYPRENLNLYLLKRGFKIKKKYKIFSQPFDKNKLFRPKISAILIHQNIYAEK